VCRYARPHNRRPHYRRRDDGQRTRRHDGRSAHTGRHDGRSAHTGRHGGRSARIRRHPRRGLLGLSGPARREDRSQRRTTVRGVPPTTAPRSPRAAPSDLNRAWNLPRLPRLDRVVRLRVIARAAGIGPLLRLPTSAGLSAFPPGGAVLITPDVLPRSRAVPHHLMLRPDTGLRTRAGGLGAAAWQVTTTRRHNVRHTAGLRPAVKVRAVATRRRVPQTIGVQPIHCARTPAGRHLITCPAGPRPVPPLPTATRHHRAPRTTGLQPIIRVPTPAGQRPVECAVVVRSVAWFAGAEGRAAVWDLVRTVVRVPVVG
jgi:hypothetical protein